MPGVKGAGKDMQFKKIIVPVDFSRAANAGVELAANVAKDSGARLLIVHVQEPPEAYNSGVMYYGIAEPTAEELMKMLTDIVPGNPSIAYEHRLIQGDPADAIVRLVREEEADLIVLSSSGRTGLTRVLMGSVAEVIVRKAPCPVLVCKQAARQPLPSVPAVG